MPDHAVYHQKKGKVMGLIKRKKEKKKAGAPPVNAYPHVEGSVGIRLSGLQVLLCTGRSSSLGQRGGAGSLFFRERKEEEEGQPDSS